MYKNDLGKKILQMHLYLFYVSITIIDNENGKRILKRICYRLGLQKNPNVPVPYVFIISVCVNSTVFLNREKKV